MEVFREGREFVCRFIKRVGSQPHPLVSRWNQGSRAGLFFLILRGVNGLWGIFHKRRNKI